MCFDDTGVYFDVHVCGLMSQACVLIMQVFPFDITCMCFDDAGASFDVAGMCL